MSEHPFCGLRRTTRSEVALTDLVAGWLALGRELALPGLEPALGLPVVVRAGLPRPGVPSAGAEPACSAGVVLEHVPSGLRAVLEVDAPLAIGLAALALGRELDESLPAPRSLDRLEQGVLLYLVGRALWAAPGLASELRVLGLAADALRPLGSRPFATVPLAIRAGTLGGHALVHLPAGAEAAAAAWRGAGRAATATLARLDGLAFAVHVLVGRVELSVAEWSSAAPGDAVVVDPVWARPEGGRFGGEARLRFAWGGPRWAASVGAGGEVTLEGPIAQEGGTMADQETTGQGCPPEDLLAELPMALTVELGRIALTARQALELRAGQTLYLGRRPGDPVELRAGAKLLARGDLVDVEGELAVRLVEIYPDAAR